MHVCFASLDYPDKTSGGGVGVYVKTIGHELVRKGHRVSVIAPRTATSSQDITDDRGVKIYPVNSGNIHWYISKLPIVGNICALPIREIEWSRAVLNTIRKIDKLDPIDIVEGTETGAYYFSRLRAEIKTIIRLHGETYTFLKYTPPGHIPVNVRLSRYLQRKALLQADQLTSPSSSHAEEIKSELEAKEISIKVIPNPFPIPEKSKLKERAHKDLNQPVFLFVGRLERRKGIIPLLKAIPKIIKKIPAAKFIFAGKKHPTMSSNEIEYLIKDLDISESVVFSGHVSSVEMESLYMESSVIVLPSYYETFGYVYFEALMYDLPIVAFDTGTAGDFIIDGENGFLVPVDDIDALADACVRSVNMNMRIPQKGEYSKYSAESVCEEMIKVYNDLLLDKNPEHSKRTVLTSTHSKSRMFNVFLSPHFDDAVFSCGGLINELIRQGQDALIVTIFGAIPDYLSISTFAQEIHKKWKSEDPVSLRRGEDMNAIETLGAKLVRLDFLDCIYRKTKDNHPLYNNYESLKGTVHPYDNNLHDLVYDRVMQIIGKYNKEEIQIFSPLGVGNHVDHQIVKMVAMRLLSEGFNVFFYEELPYCFWNPEGVKDVIAKNGNEWSAKIFHIDMKAKLNALKSYNSQFAGLGGSFRIASKRFKKYAALVGNGKFAERFWVFNSKKN